MEQKFIDAALAARKKAALLGIRLRPLEAADAVKQTHRGLSGTRPCDGFDALIAAGHPELTLEALAVDKRFTALFTDEEANVALMRLLEAGYY